METLECFGESRTALMKECLRTLEMRTYGLVKVRTTTVVLTTRRSEKQVAQKYGALSLFEQCLERVTDFISPVTMALYWRGLRPRLRVWVLCVECFASRTTDEYQFRMRDPVRFRGGIEVKKTSAFVGWWSRECC